MYKCLLPVTLGYYYGWTVMPVMQLQLRFAVIYNCCSGAVITNMLPAESTLHKLKDIV